MISHVECPRVRFSDLCCSCLYINDFQKSSKLLTFVLFADDTGVCFSHKNPNTLVNTVNTELSRIYMNGFVVTNCL